MNEPVVVLEAASKWYGTTVALSEVSFALGPGVTGLLGKNGAGKSTALKLLAGFATPDRGSVRVLGLDPRVDHSIHRRLGVLPDRDGLWPFMSPLRLVSMLARLRGVADPEAAARRALQEVDFDPDDRRPVKVLSKGNRQRVKLAQALAHDPEVLLLDEPLNGLDPQQRRHVVDLVRDLGERGRTVLVSSHVLHEVERMAPRVVVLVNGRLVAEGATTAIRDLLAERPRTIRVEAADGGAAPLAQALIGDALVGSVRFEDGGLTVETPDAERFAHRLPAHARRVGATLRRVEPIGEDLESVYEYLEERARGSRRT
jgi:ABC-2 type transport system ATP-binding protein